MAENRCPMCGEKNPEDLEICQYCGARLTPLILSDSKSDSEKSPEHFGDSLNRKELQDSNDLQRDERSTNDDQANRRDWLDNLRIESEYQDHSPSIKATEDDNGEADTPADDEDWLERIRSLGGIS